MPIPLQTWEQWRAGITDVNPHATVLDEAFRALVATRPGRRAFWSDELVWELASVGLPERAADALRAAVEPRPAARIALHDLVDPADDPSPDGPGQPDNVLLASSPRAGNTLLRRLLAELGYHEYAVHDLDDVIWSLAPRPFVVQHHAGPGPSTAAFTAARQAKVLTVVRHPIDVLCSVRAFAQRAPSTRFWLDATIGLEHVDLAEDEAFVAWATSAPADRLLAVSTDWARQPEVETVRYETMADDPAGLLDRLAAHFGVVGDGDRSQSDRLAAAVASIPAMHRTAAGPEAWRRLPTDVLDALAGAHRHHLDALGYDIT